MHKKVKIHRLLDKKSPSHFFLSPSVRILEKIKRLGYRPRMGGWRTVAQSYLKSEQSRFTLAVFRLDLWSDAPLPQDRGLESAKAHLIERSALFMRAHPVAHFELEWGRFSVRSKKKEPLDIVLASFDGEGLLGAIRPYFDERHGAFNGLPEDLQNELNSAIVYEYSYLKDVKDPARPRLLKARLIKWARARVLRSKIRPLEAISYIERILNSIFIHFEPIPGSGALQSDERFKYPDFISRKDLGSGVLNICARFTPDYLEADLWFHVSHVPLDGVPMQEILDDLKAKWHTRGALVFPALDGKGLEGMDIPRLCSARGGEDDQYILSRFIDFRPLLEAREELNKRNKDRLPSPITFVSMLAWALAHDDIFRGRKFLFPVDLPGTDRDERTLGFVAIRPSDYFAAGPGAFLAYQREFNRRLYRAQRRISDIHKLCEIFAACPPAVYWFMKRYLQGMLSDIFGSVVITTIKSADFFIAPSADIIMDGFIAIGNYSIPTEGSKRVGLVSIKSLKERTSKYMEALEKAVSFFR